MVAFGEIRIAPNGGIRGRCSLCQRLAANQPRTKSRKLSIRCYQQADALTDAGTDSPKRNAFNKLICVDRHNRFDHHDFRVMAAGTSTVWALYRQVACFRIV
jgi:hypothetical protein